MKTIEALPTELSADERETFLAVLKARFDRHLHRHPGLTWEKVLAKLTANPDKIRSLHEMERTGGEPDAVKYDPEKDEYIFVDCAPESPAGRRNICYDRAALDARKEHKPGNSAMDMARDMGIELLNEEQYRYLQDLGKFDTKTSSWIETPTAIRSLGGALFGDCRYEHVFIYHNGADSYYGARGFRGILRV